MLKTTSSPQVERMAFPSDQTKLFAYTHTLEPTVEGWNIYDPVVEFQRLGLIKRDEAEQQEEQGQDDEEDDEELARHFRAVGNYTFELSPTYPPLFVIPAALSESELDEICNFRSRQRLPTVVWAHPDTQATLSRCAQPMPGVKGKRCVEDEKLFMLLRTVNPTNSEVLKIIDARPFKAAVGNQVMGKGTRPLYRFSEYFTVEF